MQMVAKNGPKVVLGETDARRIVVDNLNRPIQAIGKNRNLRAGRESPRIELC